MLHLQLKPDKLELIGTQYIYTFTYGVKKHYRVPLVKQKQFGPHFSIKYMLVKFLALWV